MPVMPSPSTQPAQIRSDETVWITLSDGVRLAARIWRPAGAGKVPAILEYLPYRRRDRHRVDDSFTHPFFAGQGYSAVRVDMRGAGDSDGVMRDEYTPQEWSDCREVIAWIAAQDWSDGTVGMIGLSWSGFNALQLAALSPPALKAIVTTCASDDRYRDDMHYMGGCLINDCLQYGATFFTWLATPPDPAIVGERWREIWRERLEVLTPRAGEWLRHQTRDAYWRSGSVAVDYSKIRVPVLAAGGWADGYSNAILRLMTGLSGPRKAVIGPWAHAYPHVATPGPRIDFLGLVLRWMDRWLKGVENGIDAEPVVTAWMQESEPPAPSYALRKGSFVAEDHWPSPSIVSTRWELGDVRLGPGERMTRPLTVCSPTSTGTASGEWCPYGWGADMPLDQRADDGCSLCFDSAPLMDRLALLGGPEMELTLSVDAPEAMLAVRLNDVSPDGVSRRITYGLVNLALDDACEAQRPLVPGKPLKVRIRLNDVGYAVPAGHRLRVAVSTSYWPLAWPAPVRAAVTLHDGALTLPQRLSLPNRKLVPDLGAPREPKPMPVEVLVKPERGRQSLVRDVSAGRVEMTVVRNLGAMHLPETDITVRGIGREVYETYDDAPERTRSTAIREASLERGDWKVKIATRSVLTVEGADYVLVSEIDAFEGSERIFSRSWTERIRRVTAVQK